MPCVSSLCKLHKRPPPTKRWSAINAIVATTATKLFDLPEGFEADFFIQNLCANSVYFLKHQSQSATHGIKLVVSTGSITKDHWMKTVYVLADCASSDVRFVYRSNQ